MNLMELMSTVGGLGMAISLSYGILHGGFRIYGSFFIDRNNREV